jgi:hypothetical protein
MASLDDLLTAAKNIVTAINGVNVTVRASIGTLTSPTLITDTVITTSPGRLVNFAVTITGSGNGALHNASTVATATAANLLVIVPQTLGVVPVGQAFTVGLVYKRGTGQSANVTYYLG